MTTAAEPPLGIEAVCEMSADELRAQLTSRELSAEGLKPALMARLLAHAACGVADDGARGTKRPAAENFDDVPTCPICFDLLREEIFQCTEGHVICGSCKGSLPSARGRPQGACPECRKPMGDIRNRGMEGILARSRMPCRFHERGCPMVGVKGERSEHEPACEFDPEKRPCPLASCSHRCKPEDMWEHLSDAHGKSVHVFFRGRSMTHCLNCTNFADPEGHYWTILWRMHGTTGLYLIHVADEDDTLRIAAVQVFGERTELVMQVKLRLVHGEITIDLKPTYLDGCPRFKNWKAAADKIGAEFIEMPKSMIKIERTEGPKPERLTYGIMEKST